MKTEETANAEYFQRSAQVPVTMVSAVSMNTIWNRNMTMTATSYAPAWLRKNPCVPHKPNDFPNKLMLYSPFMPAPPPNVAYGPTPPIWMANPQTQNANSPKP